MEFSPDRRPRGCRARAEPSMDPLNEIAMLPGSVIPTPETSGSCLLRLQFRTSSWRSRPDGASYNRLEANPSRETQRRLAGADPISAPLSSHARSWEAPERPCNRAGGGSVRLGSCGEPHQPRGRGTHQLAASVCGSPARRTKSATSPPTTTGRPPVSMTTTCVPRVAGAGRGRSREALELAVDRHVPHAGRLSPSRMV